MDLTVQQQCPSCGAEIELLEADRLLLCPFCGVRNYRINQGPARFVLPRKTPAAVLPQDLFYAPYLRLRGCAYSCLETEVRFRIVDTTALGVGASGLPLSLGLRPQAMQVVPAGKEMSGRFLRQSVKAAAILEKTVELGAEELEPEGMALYDRTFVGETLSLVYLPLYLAGGVLHDGVTNQGLARSAHGDELREKSLSFQEKWLPHFLNTLCPSCGVLLEGEKDSLVLSCHNCHTSWEEADGRFVSLPWRRIGSRASGAIFLPFWRVTLHGEGVPLRSFADFLRLTNQPVVVRGEHEQMELAFWIPAFKVRPRVFLNMARSVTLSQLRLPAGEAVMARGMYPVTLARSEAVKALKVVLAESTVNKRDVLPLLPELTLQPLASELVYLPFLASGQDLVQEQIMLSVTGVALHTGRNL